MRPLQKTSIEKIVAKGEIAPLAIIVLTLFSNFCIYMYSMPSYLPAAALLWKGRVEMDQSKMNQLQIESAKHNMTISS